MKAILYTLLAFFVPVAIVVAVEIYKISRRYRSDAAYHKKMDNCAQALKRKRKIEKEAKRIERRRRYIEASNGYPEPLRSIFLS